MEAKTIEEVISQLKEIRQKEREKNSPLCLFPALYQKVTEAVRDKILEGNYFEDNARMEKLDVIFANRYIKAYHAWHANEPHSMVWKEAFVTTKSRYRILILQHLLLGMNAHINLDLGIAAAQVLGNSPVDNLKNDFNKINDLLFAMVETVQQEIEKYSPWLRVVDKIGGRSDEKMFEFSLKAARNYAWRLTKYLNQADQNAYEVEIAKRDEFASKLTKRVINPGLMVRLGIFIAGLKESRQYNEMFIE